MCIELNLGSWVLFVLKPSLLLKKLGFFRSCCLGNMYRPQKWRPQKAEVMQYQLITLSLQIKPGVALFEHFISFTEKHLAHLDSAWGHLYL